MNRLAFPQDLYVNSKFCFTGIHDSRIGIKICRNPESPVKESDWKHFSDMVPKLRERYLAECNARIAALLTRPDKNETDHFWDAMEEMNKEAKVLRRCLDGHSRSNMWLSILSMIGAGMLKKEDMAVFSEDLQKEVSYAFEKNRG